MTKLTLTIKIPDWLERPFVSVLLLYRRVRYGYAFRRIRLTQGKFAIVDPEDYDWLSKYKWFAMNHRRNTYACRAAGFKRGRNRNLRMHQQIMQVPDGLLIDHINRNGLDNRRANLRVATAWENSWNVAKRRGNCSSQYKGVAFRRDKKSRKWRARIRVRRIVIPLGEYDTEKQAAKAYDTAARKYHKEFAVLNFGD